MVQGFAVVYPSEVSIVSPVVFPVDAPNPLSCLLAQPEFHALEGIVADIPKCAARTRVAIIVSPSPEQVVECINLVSGTSQGRTPAGHILDFALQLHHAFLAGIEDQFVITTISINDPLDGKAKKVKSIRDMRNVSFLLR